MRFVFIALTLSFLLPLGAAAQLAAMGDTAPFAVSVNPQYPAPYSRAILSAESSSLDLTNATMTITIAGKNVYEGNIQPTPVTLGKAGIAVKVDVKVSVGGTTYTQSVTIRPQDVSLIAEPVASTPPLYPGKASMPIEGGVRIVAVANFRTAGGTALDPTELSYEWEVDDTKVAHSSGIGRSSFIVASPLQYRARSVSVTVKSRDGTLVGGDTLSLSPQEPLVRIYENDPLLGIRFDRALVDTYTITGTESTLYAAPFSVPITSGAPFIQWFLNGVAAQTGDSITLRPTGDGQGNASLSLTASSGNQTAATASLSLLFGATESTNFFGL